MPYLPLPDFLFIYFFAVNCTKITGVNTKKKLNDDFISSKHTVRQQHNGHNPEGTGHSYSLQWTPIDKKIKCASLGIPETADLLWY